jgi:hypothetical protein
LAIGVLHAWLLVEASLPSLCRERAALVSALLDGEFGNAAVENRPFTDRLEANAAHRLSVDYRSRNREKDLAGTNG